MRKSALNSLLSYQQLEMPPLIREAFQWCSCAFALGAIIACFEIFGISSTWFIGSMAEMLSLRLAFTLMGFGLVSLFFIFLIFNMDLMRFRASHTTKAAAAILWTGMRVGFGAVGASGGTAAALSLFANDPENAVVFWRVCTQLLLILVPTAALAEGVLAKTRKTEVAAVSVVVVYLLTVLGLLYLTDPRAFAKAIMTLGAIWGSIAVAFYLVVCRAKTRSGM